MRDMQCYFGHISHQFAPGEARFTECGYLTLQNSITCRFQTVNFVCRGGNDSTVPLGNLGKCTAPDAPAIAIQAC